MSEFSRCENCFIWFDIDDSIMLRRITAKKVKDGEIIGFWSRRADEEMEEFATLEQIYKFATRNRDDVKAGNMEATEKSQYCIMKDGGMLIISIREEDGKYLLNHIRGQNLQEALDELADRN